MWLSLIGYFQKIRMRNSLSKIYIGTMSGTSHDGIDICALQGLTNIQLLSFKSYKYPRKLRQQISDVIEKKELGIDHFFALNKNIGHAFSKSINQFLAHENIKKNRVSAIGLSGQTLWHEPKTRHPFSIQAGDPKVVAKECNINVVGDFRNDHIRLGGEGAPLVPEFHKKIFSRGKNPSFIVNIGGISNFTYLDGLGNFFGSDCGPGNALMDIYCQKYLELPFDKRGRFASAGSIHEPSLKKMLAHQFFRQHHPKSTGKEIFNMAFIPKPLLEKPPHDVLATLTELTAICIARSISSRKIFPKEAIVCGGGLKNEFLIQRAGHHAKINFYSSQKYGYDPQAIEAMAFGWMAQQRIEKKPLAVMDTKGLLGTITKPK